MIVISTPHITPSQNECYRNLNVKGLRGRAKTTRYKQWENAFGWDALAQVPVSERLKGPYTIKITICRTKRHRLSDVMNREKPTSDCLQAIGIIEDDRLCESGTVCWGDANGGMRVEIWPWHP